MQRVLIASYDMEVGGVERSLSGLLNAFDYDRYDVELMLYRHQGDFMELLPGNAKLLKEMPQYASFRASIAETLRNGQMRLGLSRVLSKAHAVMEGGLRALPEPGYIQQQLMWRYALPFLPRLKRKYDIAISFLWPHYFVADKVEADLKIAWIHTDYSTIATKRKMDLAMWQKFDYIVAVSDACKDSFVGRYKELRDKTVVIENIISPPTVRALAEETKDDNPLLRDPRFKLLTVGRLSHQKGFDMAIEALKRLTERGYGDIAWYVVGYGVEEDNIRRLIAESGLQDRFFLLGKRQNPYPYMKACDLYVQPSRYEGKAVTVTEAKILGKPVLITDYATAGSQVLDGVDGCVAPISAEGVANKIEEMYRDRELLRRLSNACAAADYGGEPELEKLYGLFAASGRKIG